MQDKKVFKTWNNDSENETISKNLFMGDGTRGPATLRVGNRKVPGKKKNNSENETTSKDPFKDYGTIGPVT